MRGLSLRQPYAGLVASGRKTYETRSWGTSYRGPVTICASLDWSPATRANALQLADLLRAPSLRSEPRGVAVCVAELHSCVQMTEGPSGSVLLPSQYGSPVEPGYDEIQVGGWAPGRYAWELRAVRRLVDPVPIKGRLGLFRLSAEQVSAIMERV